MPSSNGHGTTRQRLAVAQHERREAIASTAGKPTNPCGTTLKGIGPSPRDKLPTLDDLTGPDAPRARWKLVAAGVGALMALAEIARQIVAIVKH